MKKYLAAIIILTSVIMMTVSYSYILTSKESGGIDNTNHGWEVRQNSGHKQPDIPQNAKDMLIKYNGIYVGEPDKKIVYLTIDLGYESGNTDKILDVLNKNNVKATFFIVSSYLKKNPRIVDRIVYEGHSLQNHTANYKHLNELSEYQIKREVMDLHEMVESRYGVSMKYLRLPYEDWSERVLKTVSETGYKTVFWSIACVDWVKDKDASYIYNSVIKNHHNGAIILLHAVSKESPKAIDMIIKELKNKEYEFRTLDI